MLSVPLLKMSASPVPSFQLPVLQSSPQVTVADMINNNKYCNYLRNVLIGLVKTYISCMITHAREKISLISRHRP